MNTGGVIGNTGTTTGTAGKKPEVSFTLASQTIPEQQPTTTIIAKLSPSSTQTVTVPLTITPGATPLSSSDYSYTAPPPSTSTLLTFLPNQTEITITVGIINDTLTEQSESALFKLGTPTNAVLGPTPTHTLIVTDNDVPPTCVITLFNAVPTSITSGQSSILNWKTTDCITTTVDNNIGVVTPPSNGSITTGVLTSTKTFKLTATGVANTATALMTVTVTPLCLITSFTANPSVIDSGTVSTLFWTTANCTNTSVDQNINTVTPASGGSYSTGNLTQTTTFTLTASASNTVTAQVTVDVLAACTPNTWTQKSDFGSGWSRQSPTGFSIEEKGYVGVGWDYGLQGLAKDFWQYDPVTNSWTQKADYGGGKRQLAAGFSLGSKGYIGTGDDSIPNNGNKKDFWEYCP